MPLTCARTNLSAKNCALTEYIERLSRSTNRDLEAASDLANLDLLRSVAVGLVFTGHMLGIMKLRGLGDIGHFGVLLFFVHTSLVLMLSMGRLGLSGCKLYLVFMVRRIFRIYPLSILTVLLVVSFHVPSAPWVGGYIRPDWQELLSNMLLTQNITHSKSVNCVLWSLPFEVQMYAVLPLLYLLIRRVPSLQAAMLIWLAGASVAVLEYIVRIGTIDSDFLLLRYFPCFLAGVFAWRLMETRGGRPCLSGWYWVLVLMILAVSYRLEDALRVYGPNVLGALNGAVRSDHRIWLLPYLDLVRDWVFCGITGLALPFFAEISSRWLNAITRRIARYSYGIYVCHVPILWLCFSKLHVGFVAINVITSVFLTAIVSLALYRFVEHPGIRFGKHFATRLVSGITLKERTA